MPEIENLRVTFDNTVDGAGLHWHDDGTDPEYCGVHWIITTCLTGIALGVGFGGLLWLVLS